MAGTLGNLFPRVELYRHNSTFLTIRATLYIRISPLWRMQTVHEL